MLRHLLSASLVIACAAPAAGRPVDWDDDPESLPLDGLAIYDGYRGSLIKKGWKPVPHRHASPDGFPEVVCGSALCSADWKSPDGSPFSFTVWRHYHQDSDRSVLILAPAFDEGNLPP
jgi:hypothetical protein